MKKESRRAFTLSYLADNEPHGWLVERCNAIAHGRPLSHCWKGYMLSGNAFMEWVMQSPTRAIQVANALALAQIGRWEKASKAKRANEEAEREFKRLQAERTKPQPPGQVKTTTTVPERPVSLAHGKPCLGPI